MSEEQNPQSNTLGIDNPMATPYYRMAEKVHVLLVDHDKRFGTEMADLLKSYGYRVTTVGMNPTTVKMLSKGKEKIDVMIINVHSPDLLSFQLLAQAVTLNILSLFVCDEHNELLANKLLDDGAYLYLKKPLDKEIMKCLWQFVVREKRQNDKDKEGLEIGNTSVRDEEQVGEKNLSNTVEQNNNINVANNDIVLNTKYNLRSKKGRKITKEINEGGRQVNAKKVVVGRRDCIKWTAELHAKFNEVVNQLGEGRCFPKKILELMNVPGLTRMQVASHLQKCRHNNWRTPEERTYIRRPSEKGSSSGSHKRSSFIKFGTKPHFQRNVSNMQQQRNPDQTQSGKGFPVSSLNVTNTFARGESSKQRHPYHPKRHVQPHYLNIRSPFNNSFLSAKNNTGGGLQQQNGSLFEMVGSQRLQDLVNRSTNYQPGLEFNNGDHQTQNDYSFDLNVACATTNSGSIPSTSAPRGAL